MVKHDLFPDDFWALRSHQLGTGTPPPDAADDTLFVDEGDPQALGTEAAAGSESVSAGGAKPVATIPQLADYLISGFWQYNGTIAHHWASNTVTFNINGLNFSEQALALAALQAWHEVANVNFVQTSGTANITFVHTGTMIAATSANWNGSGLMTSATVDISTDWVTNDGGAYDGKTGIDSYAYQTYIHEIGHALGLGHQGPYNGSATYSANAIYADDTWQYSIMSYFSEDNYSGSSYRYVVTPQIADIYAVASIYGAATSTRTGDTVYGFHSNAGSVFDFSSYSQAPALTIYDSAGNDTLDCSGYSAAQSIDLHPGAFSSVGGLANNIGIALNATIENAIGGGGNDTLIGGAGNNTLLGEIGHDKMYGGSGHDTMYGGDDNDYLHGGIDADIMLGGLGNDIYDVDNAFDYTGEPQNGGQDTVYTSVTYALTANIENLTLIGVAPLEAGGNELDNRLVGNAANNVMTGAGGFDVIIGGGGNDAFVFRAGFDVDYIADFSAGAGSDDVIYASTAVWSSLADVLAHASQVGADAVITDNLGDTLVLAGVNKFTLAADDFVFF